MIIYNKCEEIIYYVESHSFYVSELMMLCNHDIIFALEWFSKRITKKQKKNVVIKLRKPAIVANYDFLVLILLFMFLFCFSSL
jgi:hypothetical protein